MKIYLDDNNQLIGYEIVFHKKGSKRPKTNLDLGMNKREVFINEKQYKTIRDYLDNGGKVTELRYRNGNILVNKLPVIANDDNDCKKCPKTVIVLVDKYNPNSDLSRHFKNKDQFIFKELTDIPYSEIKEQYLYYFDKATIESEKAGFKGLSRNLKRFFGLYKDNELAAFLYVLQMDSPTIVVLYHNEIYSNAGYVAINYLIELLKKEGIKYLDLGGLTKNDSGINQFKEKFGLIIPIKDRELFSASKTARLSI